MRIAIIAPPWLPVPPPAYGGTEAVVDRLARGFHGRGHEVLLWTTGDSTCPVPCGHVLPTAPTGRMGHSALELEHVITGYERILDWGPDIVHDHTLVGPIFADRYRHLVVLTTNHGPFESELHTLYRTIGDRVRIIAISYDQARRAAPVPVAGVIHHGLDVEQFPEGTGTGDDQGPYLLFLGRMAPEKGARRAIDAANAAGARLLMAAKIREPTEHAYFAEYVESQLSDRISYVGEVGGAEKAKLLAGARALLNPIAWPEPFGLVMIEALACGTPVIALASGAAPELIDDGTTGFVCADEADLPDRIARIDELDRAACRAAAESRFSTARMVADHLALFERSLPARAKVVA